MLCHETEGSLWRREGRGMRRRLNRNRYRLGRTR